MLLVTTGRFIWKGPTKSHAHAEHLLGTNAGIPGGTLVFIQVGFQDVGPLAPWSSLSASRHHVPSLPPHQASAASWLTPCSFPPSNSSAPPQAPATSWPVASQWALPMEAGLALPSLLSRSIATQATLRMLWFSSGGWEGQSPVWVCIVSKGISGYERVKWAGVTRAAALRDYVSAGKG